MNANLRIGIIGGGRIGRVHATNFLMRGNGAEVTAIADPFPSEELNIWAASQGIPQVLKDYKAIINDPEVDAVLICSPTNTHATICCEAATVGKHIFCEKPLDQDPAVIRKTIKVMEDAGVVFQIGFNRRFDHNFRAIRCAVEDGTVGDIHLLRITSRDPSPPPIDYVKVSGGLFMDMAIHDFDMARYLTGSEVIKVHAAGAVLVDPAIGAEGDIDTAITTLWFANGALGVIENSRKAVYGYDQRAEVFGSKGAAISNNDKASTVLVSGIDGVRGEKPLHFFLERYAHAYVEEIGAFVNAIQNGATVPGGKAALNSVLIAMAAKQSMETGLPVDVPCNE